MSRPVLPLTSAAIADLQRATERLRAAGQCEFNHTGETTMTIFEKTRALLSNRKAEPEAPQPDKSVTIPAGTMCWIQPPFVRIHAPSDRDLLVTMPHDAVWHGDTPVEVNATKIWTVTVHEAKP